jgi:membrane protease YdiL (CAAX protease family)/tRNA A-37 threonylcarbamoyl transferase component Bud32
MCPKTINPFQIFLYVLLVVAVFFILTVFSAGLTVGLLNLAQSADSPLGTFLTEKGPARIMRRVLLVGAIIIIVSSLKKFGWRGWKDCGWTSDDHAISSPLAKFGLGAALGFISLGGIALMTIYSGLHQLKPLAGNYQAITVNVFFFCLSGLAVALVEETVCRGILFRAFARIWRAWPAAIIISLFFAAAHFVGPNDAAFNGSSSLKTIFNVTLATIKSIVPPNESLIRFLNLALLGILLCAFVMRTKTIWMSVGAHAVWVMIIKIHSEYTVLNPAALFSVWLGKRNDFMDSLAAALIFIVLTLLVLLGNKKTGRTVKINGRTWHVQPSGKNLDNFIDKGEDLFEGGNILKAYPGCRVIAANGLVLKKYFPRDILNALRFAFRPPRTRRAFILADTLTGYGLPTPPVLAWSANRRFGFLMSESMVVSEITGAEPLTDWLKRKTDSSATRLKVMEAYGNLMAAFHARCYSNRDLKHENVMCSREEPWLISVVDLDGVRKHLFISRRRAGKDLMRVGKSLASLGWTGKPDIDAFFRAYNSMVPTRLHRHAFPD